MDRNSILKSSILDIVFDGKNKSYGAYELRTNYNTRITKSLIITFLLVGILISVFGFSNELDSKKTEYKSTEVVIIEIHEPKQTPPPPPPPPKEIQTTQPNTVKFTTPIIVENPDEPPPAQIDMVNADISTVTRKGDTCQVAPLPIDPVGNGGDDVIGDEIFERVEIEASFPGGDLKWKQYLERVLSDANPAENGAPEGVYSVLVQFVVDTDGSISDVKPLTDFGYGMEDIAVKTIKRGPKWKPAIQNGRQVKAYRKQMITFQVLSE